MKTQKPAVVAFLVVMAWMVFAVVLTEAAMIWKAHRPPPKESDGSKEGK